MQLVLSSDAFQLKATGAMKPMLNPNEIQLSSSSFSPRIFISMV
jgi:hypothetical protein